ncbi:hypothetical protein T492DRAFT_965649 [Pavlovales sp. CCMP2436]|nr:hypothetical protein T492DRAFT_965649 [Pavlovales sp. CCMP2436]|mmetsp:Transcript_23709/g.56122  ORF Transcript_23709/g.56122 Transcript_23709/m.56122 type:complete len:244 (-) Transcript_23709:266-997(-)
MLGLLGASRARMNAVNRSALSVVGAAFLLAAGIILLTDSMMHQHHTDSKREGAAMLVIAPQCGQWDAHSTCEGEQDVMPPTKHGDPPSEEECVAFCEKRHKPPKTAKDAEKLEKLGPVGWCCGMRGTECAWSEGQRALPTLKRAVAAVNASSYIYCPPPAKGEVLCDAKVAQDAMKIDGEIEHVGPGTCSQICLPMGLWGIAEKRGGVVHGLCSAFGYSQFIYPATAVGIKYNVYSNDAYRQP